MKIKKLMQFAAKWEIWEIELEGPSKGNPYTDVTIQAEFSNKSGTFQTQGFYDGNSIYKVRFMPEALGQWRYKIISSDAPSEVLEGSFECTEASLDSHGPVRVADTFHFAYEDGMRYIPVGTTCYAWIHQPEDLRKQTLETLEASPFNKIRMCIFPKHYDYNHNEPEVFPYVRNAAGEFDFTRFDPEYFKILEESIISLKKIGVEADLILFHPYDKWGFAKMGQEADDLYVKYIVSRLSAFSNVWWSLANEYDLMAIISKSKDNNDWERIAGIIQKIDPYVHLCSIHNCFDFYDYTRPWVTHCSMQRQDIYKTAEFTKEWRQQYNKPIVIDECAYEGDINHGWGNITGMEMTRRFWEGAVRGGYVGHGETYLNKEEVLWWSKGGKLVGDSPDRIRFLKDILSEGPEHGINPIDFGRLGWDLPCGGVPGEYYLFYFGFNQPKFRTFALPEGLSFKVDVIDTWNMTVEGLPGSFTGEFKIDLPGRQYMAIRMVKI